MLLDRKGSFEMYQKVTPLYKRFYGFMVRPSHLVYMPPNGKDTISICTLDFKPTKLTKQIMSSIENINRSQCQVESYINK